MSDNGDQSSIEEPMASGSSANIDKDPVASGSSANIDEEPVASDNINNGEDEKLMKLRGVTDNQFFESLTSAELNYFKINKQDVESSTLLCTVCRYGPTVSIEEFFVRHPLLGVPICRPCRKYYYKGRWKKDEEGFYEYCLWCGRGGDLLMCSKQGCPNVFCKNCIKRNLGRGAVTAIVEAEDWSCFECKPKQIRTFRTMYYSIAQYCCALKLESLKSVRVKKEKVMEADDDLIGWTLGEADEASKIFAEFVDNESSSHNSRKCMESAVISDEAYVFKKARRLAKLINVGHQNLKLLYERMMSKLADQFPAVDLDELKKLANGEEDYPDEGLSSQDTSLQEINLEDPASVTGSGDKKIKKEPQKVDREGPKTSTPVKPPRKKSESESRVGIQNESDLPADEPLVKEQEVELGVPPDLAQEIASLNESLRSNSYQTYSNRKEQQSSEISASNQKEIHSSSDSDEEMIADDAIELIVTSTNVEESGKKSQSELTSPKKSRDATSADLNQRREIVSPVISDNLRREVKGGDVVKRHKILMLSSDDDDGDTLPEKSFEGNDKSESKKVDKIELSSSDVSMTEDVSVSKEKDKTLRKGSKLTVPENISLSLLDTETVGMLAPSTEGPSAEDLEAEKAKWSVLMSSSSSNNESDEADRGKMAKRKRLRTKSQLDQKVSKKLSESEKVAELSSSNEAACDNETKVKTSTSSKKSSKRKSVEKPNLKSDQKSSKKTSDDVDDDERIRARVLLSSSDEGEDEKGNSDRSSEAKKKRSDPRGQVADDLKQSVVAKFDPETDPKLKQKTEVVLSTLSSDVSSDLKRYGCVSVVEFPELLQAAEKKSRLRNPPLSEEAKFDAEIDRLCDLKALEKKASKNTNRQGSKQDNSKGKTKEKGMALSDMSSDAESGNDSVSDVEQNGSSIKANNAFANDQFLDANEIAKRDVLASSDDDSDDEDEDDEEVVKPKAAKKETKTEKKPKIEDDDDDKEEAAKEKKKSKAVPSFLRVRLSDSDTDEEEEKARLRREKREAKEKARNLNDSSDDEILTSPRKSSPSKRKKLKLDDDSDVDDEESDVDDGAKEDGSDWSANDKKNKKKTDSSDSDITLKKRKASKRKKNDDDGSKGSSSDEEPRTKKKRRRIKKNTSSSEDEKSENGSPSKGRHKIRKIIKDKDLLKSTKEADREERDRRKRMEDRQMIYNKTFELSHDSLLEELPLDFDPETKEILVEVDKRLVKKMKPHQGRGIKFMWDACFETQKDVLENKIPGGAILAHCMGLGKTLQTIGLIHTVMKNFPEQIKSVLILCPVNTIKNWVEEFEKWLTEDMMDDIQEVHDGSLGKDQWERVDRLKHWKKNGGCMVMGYDMYRNLTNTTGKKFKNKQQEVFQQALVNPGPDIIICDEGHILKNTSSALNIAVNKISTRRRIILTGTPLQNNLTEYFAMVDFVKPQLLGSYKEFKNRFVNPIQYGQHSDSTEKDVRIMKKRSFILCDLLKGCMQRLDYNVLTPYLQPKYEYVLCLCLTNLQKKLYTYYLENYARAGQIGDEGKMEGGKKGGLFYDVQNLSRIWNHPCILAKAKERADNKRMFDDEEEEIDEEGSLKDFVVDGSDEDTPMTSSNDEGKGGANSDSDVECLSDTPKPKRTTRGDRQKGEVELIGGLDDAKKEAQANSRNWWSRFLPDGKDSNLELFKLEHGVKMVLLMDILRECEIFGDKVLVFSQSLLSLDLIETFLRIENDRLERSENAEEANARHFGSWVSGKDYYRLDGSTSADNRKKWCNFFNKKTNLRTRLFLISTKAGGLGINLVSANRVVIFDASWNPAHDVQSIFRVYRFGQEKPVYIYRFLAKGTMEEKIYDRQVTKQSLSARVVDEQQIERHFSMNELAELYEYKDEPIESRPIPIVPKDRLLAELLAKHPEKIWKFHDHDSLLENQVDENLTEEDRKAAWEEFENEKKGINNLVGNPSVNNLASFNFNPEEIAAQYKIQYPHLTDDQIVQATRAYIMQIQSAFTRKPAYDKSHYQQEMARARGIQQQMYPGMFRQNQQNGASGSSSSNEALTADQMMELKREAYKSQAMQHQLQVQQQRLRQQQLLQQQVIAMARNQQPSSASVSDEDDDIVVLDGSPQFEEYNPTSRPSGSGLSSRRGRPRLDPDSDPLV